MLNRLTIILLFFSTTLFAQEILPEKKCDTTFFNSLSEEAYLIENASCGMSGPIQAFYFTSYKEFSNYYNNSKYPLNTSCYSQFNNFNFKKYNMVLINYDFERSSTRSVNVDVKYKDGKYLLLIRHVLNGTDVSLLMPGYFNKCISLPKERSLSNPAIFICNY